MVEVFTWNPKRPVFKGRIGRRIPVRRHVNNFGDLLGPIVVEGVLDSIDVERYELVQDVKLLTVGSVLHFAEDGDVVWGAGVNGKVPKSEHRFADLDVRAVRGPLTRDFLVERGIDVPDVFGDPALLLPEFVPELREWSAEPRYGLTVVPNLNDYRHYPRARSVLNPQSNLWSCLERIARSRMVVGSSLHALVVAESIGVPARAVQSKVEPEFKYADYYLGTGRDDFTIASTVGEAVRLGGEPSPVWSRDALRRAFPSDLWRFRADN